MELEKGQIHSGITLNMFAMSESPKFRQITNLQISYRKKEGSVGIVAKHSILFFYEHGEEVHLCYKSSSSAAALFQVCKMVIK